MEKWIPYEKLSKKKQRELAAKGRRGWGGVCPVTRKPPNPKAYNRRKTPRWEEMPPAGVFCLLFCCCVSLWGRRFLCGLSQVVRN